MKKRMSLIVVFSIILSILTLPTSTFAGVLSSRKLGVVTEVIDGEALAIQFGDSNVLIKLIGVKTDASQKALEYVNNTAKGKYVGVMTENFYSVGDTASSYYRAYVYMNDTGEMLNSMILKEGLGELNTTHGLATKYYELVKEQNYAKSRKLGIWNNSSSNAYYYYGESININTATYSELRNISPKMTSSIVSNMINYRKYNVFNTLAEIKFVPGMTKVIYDDIYAYITVVTNINEASEEELLTLSDLSQNDVDAIMAYREDHQFTSLTQFYTKTGIGSTKYNENKNFISLDFEDSVDYIVGDKVVNINTATQQELGSLYSMETSLITDIIRYREEQLFRSMDEVEDFFIDKNQRIFYNDIKEFIVVR